jgi:Protein of unknown function (DUF3455)
MSYRTLKSKLFQTIGGLAAAGMVLAGVATITAFTASSPQAANPGGITPPPLPDGMAPVPAGNELFLGTHAVGTQNYVCQPSGAGVAYVLFTPQATLFGKDGVQIITHFNSPNPDEPNTDPKVVAPQGTIRATWQFKDTSRVWAEVHQPNGAVTVKQDAIAWVLLDAVGHLNGPTGGDMLRKTTFVQRLNTTGGLAPSTGCSSLADVGNKAFVPYTADYFFYKAK